MSVSLCCPNCGAEVGILEDGKKIFFYKNENTGNPDCKYCHTEDAVKINRIIYIGGISFLIIVTILMIIFL